MSKFVRTLLGWQRRTAVTVTAATIALVASAGIAGATAATLSGGSDGSSDAPAVVTSPGGVVSGAGPDTATGQGHPAAIAVPQADHTGAGYAEHPLMVKVHGWESQSDPQLTRTAPTGYTPAQLRSYLQLSGTGKGQTVAVVDAFHNPYATQDLATFSRQFGLPLPCTQGGKSGCFSFSSVQPFGVSATDPGWALESDLDVQMVHAIAPEASIVLVEARDSSLLSLSQAIDYAAGLKGVRVISNSYGLNEFDGETALDTHCALASALCVFSAGDGGNPGLYPAYDPHVLAVGGTTLALTPSSGVDLEVGWCCNQAATGGGVSAFEPRPAYQDQVSSFGHRGIPDVSFDADPLTGVPVYDTAGLVRSDGSLQNGWFQVGGTSVGAPAWAGIVAAADQLRAKAKQPVLAGASFQAQRLIYGMPHPAFRDITIGVDNRLRCTTPVETCRAQPGYDFVTGWGSPGPGIDTTLAAAR